MTLILSFDDYLPQAIKLGQCLAIAVKPVHIHQFPDGETKITLPNPLPENIIICRSLDQPNKKLIELILTASAAREQGATHITLVAPYLCYMRQDIAFHPGEAVSQKIIGKLLSDYFERIITIDPHLHRINNLQQVMPNTDAQVLHASHAIRCFLQEKFKHPVLLGPDQESAQWVKAIASPKQWQYTIATKLRHSDTDVAIDFSTKHQQQSIILYQQDVIIIDDIASTGKTLAEAVKQIQVHQVSSISIVITHAFFVDDAIKRLHALGVKNIWSSDSVSHTSNAFSIIETIAEQLRQR